MYIKMTNDSDYKIEYNKINYINSAQMAVDMQQLFLKRVKAGPIMTKGDLYDLNSIANDLVERGLVDSKVLKNTIMTYADNLDEDTWGNTNVVLRVIRINYDFDQEAWPLSAMESLMLHELLHIELGLDTLYDAHGIEFQRRMSLFDKREELLEWGRRLSITEEELLGYGHETH
jgi:hypothetical protein